MARKRKLDVRVAPDQIQRSQHAFEERFNGSDDEFYAGRDKVLLDEGPTNKRRRYLEEQEREIQHSDEEVLAQYDTDGDDDGASIDANYVDEEEDLEEVENWGLAKTDYYDADVVETEADAIDEEKEAKRLQQKQLKGMMDADFGFDEATWSQTADTKPANGLVVEKLPETSIPIQATPKQLADILHNRYPEFGLLARDLMELQSVWVQLHDQADIDTKMHHDGVTVRTKLNALTSYLGAISMYFAVITSFSDSKADASRITALSPNELREHTVIDNLMRSRQLWNTVKDVEQVTYRERQRAAPAPVLTVVTKTSRLNQRPKITGRYREKQSRDTSPKSSVVEDTQMPENSKERVRKPKKPLDLQSLLAQTALPHMDNASEFGDEEPLTEQQAEEKARKKKSLRFYTSQIVQKANRRGAASRDAGGDDDVPHKERLRDKQERLLKEAEKRGQQKATAEEELGGDSDEDASSETRDDYYQSLVAKSQQKKTQRQARAAAYTEAARQGAQVREEEQVGMDGKRKITYAIEKNKGLAPKRKKDVRNPRVKKRKKFDEKMKKLGSMRQVYKGGEGRGGYGGELTGIKTNIVKSVRL